jgi:protein-S-isoprenylcysteine O-methyltransferase Ste14
MTTEDDKAWIRALPLLLTGGILFSAGALIFFSKGDTTASIAAMTVGVVLTSMWAATAIIDWHEARKRRRQQDEGQ